MHALPPLTPDRKEPAPDLNGHGLYDHMGLYAPFVWMLDWVVVCVLRAAMGAGIVSPDFLRPARPKPKPVLFHCNRQLRRAKASCVRRAHRCLRKYGKVNPSDYTPRAFAHIAYIKIMPKHYSVGQFMEHYLQDNALSRVQVYGLDHAHRITRSVPQALCGALGKTLRSGFAHLASVINAAPESLGAVSDPAPP